MIRPSLALEDLVRSLLTRYCIPFEEGEPFDVVAYGLLAHLDTLEADAREAHSAAKVLGCTVADLADRAKEQHRILTETAKTMGVSIAGVLNMVTALRRSEAVLADQLKHRHDILTKCLHLLGQPNANSYDVVPDLIEGLLAKQTPDPERDKGVLDGITAMIPAQLLEEAGGSRITAVGRLVGDSLTGQARLDALRTERDAYQQQLAPMAATLQAIAEALPAELRYTEDLAGAVRQVVLTSQTNYGLYQQVQEEVAPHKQIVGILRELLEVSRPLCLAMVRELWSDDEALQDLLTTVSAERLAATLMESLAAPHDPLIPATTPPTPQAKALEGLCSVAFYRHPMTPGRLEAIGGPLLRFRPLRGGGEVIVNCERRDLEVYPLDPSDLSPEEARLAGISVPTPARNPADPYTLDPKVYAANPHISPDELEYAVAKTSGQPPKPSLDPADDDIPF